MASHIKPKYGSNKDEGLRLAFNARMYANLCKGPNGYKFLEKRLFYETELDHWFVQNLDGLPEKIQIKEIKNDKNELG